MGEKRMKNTVFPRGSEWRKWDLQIHTPFSALNNGFGTDFDTYAGKMLIQAFEKKIAVVGITDYFCIEGYKALKHLISDRKQLLSVVGSEEVAEFVLQMTFLPNIELRGFPIPDSEGRNKRVNFHVIFSDRLDIADIEEVFLRDLKFTAEGNPQGTDERWPLTLRNLETLGKRLKSQHERFQSQTDLYIGMMNAVINHEDVTNVLESKPSIFKDNYLFCLASDEDLSKYSWDGQGHLTRKILIQKSDILFSSNSNTRLFGLGKKHPSTDDFIKEFKSFKACVHSSDAHTYEQLFEPDDRRYTWIKADPTFLGLKQVLNEPDDRVYIGELPPSLIRRQTAATRVVDSLTIRKSPEATTAETWFDVSLPLNQELVAIIGNKGSGKSALADILGLLGNTPRFKSFSFLNAERFRHPKDNKARQFQADLTWADGSKEGPTSLDKDPSPQSVEKIKYIPQNYLEEICNEISLGKSTRFYSELQEVIFSHVPQAEREGFRSLDDLLEYRSKEVQNGIDLLLIDLDKLNRQIVTIEDQLTPEYKNALEEQLKERKRELQSHENTKPKAVPKPDENESAKEESKRISLELEKKHDTLKQVEEQIAQLRANESRLVRQLTLADNLLQRVQNIERQIKKTIEDSKRDFEELGLNQQSILSYSVNTKPIRDKIEALRKERKKIADALDANKHESPEAQRLKIGREIEELQAKLNAPQRAYQAYLRQLMTWQSKKEDIIGNEETVGSIKYLEKQIKDLADLPRKLSQLETEREAKTVEIYKQKERLRDYYSYYYSAVQKFLQDHPIAKTEGFKLSFNVSIMESGFAERFLQYINQRRVGFFAGSEEGSRKLQEIINETDFNSEDSVVKFTRRLFEVMKEHQGKQIRIQDQLLNPNSKNELYNFVFSLNYLSPIYNLRWDQRAIEQLSPGERGNLLLIFYLLIDLEDKPLVIDQPEENLDNQTVYRTLVPCIKDAKKRRQIVLVTHNPNLAVVCDAEQVIYAEIKKDQGNRVTYLSGSIENPAINKKIVDVLEGTRPAFDKRDQKYSLVP
jgi:ABC-type lipoprotein export system ATPase subunit